MADAIELQTEGLHFTPIRGKDARYKGWPTARLSSQSAIDEAANSGGYYTGIGLVHKTSGTCCLDIDDIEAASIWFRDKYDIPDLMMHLDGHFEVLSPNAMSGKFMFKLPPSIASSAMLQKFVITECKLEFRTGSHQDAWPGSLHPISGWTSKQKGEIEADGEYSHRGSESLLDLPLELLKIWLENQSPIVARKDGKVIRVNGQSIDNIVEGITSGKLIHPNMVDYSYGQIRDGIAPGIVKATLKGLLQACKGTVDEIRWQARYDGIEQTVDGAIARIESENKENEAENNAKKITDDDIENHVKQDGRNKRNIPWPPGRMGELATAALDYQRYQYPELAVVSAVGLIAGICGRKFDVSHPATGLNVYLTVLGPTGIGKGSVEKFINQVLFNQSGLGKVISFVGHNDFTSGTMLLKSLENAKCQVSITDEAGQSLSSKSGDPQKKTATLLDLYSKSGSNELSMNQAQRDREFTTQKLKGVSFSWINISTPEVFKREFHSQGAVANGLAPRMSIYSIDEIVLVANRKPHLTLSSDLTDRLGYLITECSKIQSVDDFKAWQLELHKDIGGDPMNDSDDAYAATEAAVLEKHYRECMRDLRGDDVNKADMHNRAYLKVLKFAGIATALNKTKSDSNPLIIGRAEWEWGKAMVEYEMDNINSFFSGSYFGDALVEGMGVVRHTVFRILSGRCDIKDPRGNVSPEQRRQRIVTKSSLYRRLKNNNILKELNDDPKFKSKPKSGIDKCVEAMAENGELLETNDASVRQGQRCYRVMEGILDGS
jgi:hypothetical protein